jgi:hypothetical protein
VAIHEILYAISIATSDKFDRDRPSFDFSTFEDQGDA